MGPRHERHLIPDDTYIADKDVDENVNYQTKREKRLFYHVRSGFFDIQKPNVAVFVFGHLLYAYSYYLLWTEFPWKTWMFQTFLMAWTGVAITAGAHRLWSHRSYKATVPLRVILMIGHSIAGQNSLFVWCRDHIIHHKYSDTDGDPHNTSRGFFFSHVGWLFKRKHPELLEKARKFDFTDLKEDPVVMLQHKYYYPIYVIFAIIIPVAIPCVLWQETVVNSFFLAYVQRYISVLHITWFINSSAHMFGDRPYNVNVKAVENRYLFLMTLGEHHHNYHHAFPQDYATHESDFSLNITKWVIDAVAFVGLAYDLKRPSMDVVRKTKLRIAKEIGLLKS